MRKDLKLIGAAAERKAILRKLRQLTRVADVTEPYTLINYMIGWMLKRCERYNRAQGGLGRKRKGV